MMIMIFKGPQGPPHATHFDEDGSFFWTLFLILKKGSQESPLGSLFGSQNGSQSCEKSIKMMKHTISRSSSVFFIDVCPTLAPKVEAPSP